MDKQDRARQLADRLRSDISRGEFHPRERLVEGELVAAYGLPRATVRAALVLLAAEGLVERSPNRSAVVRALSLDEGIELAEVRRELEALCARDAALRAQPEERERLASALHAVRLAAAVEDVYSYRQSSLGFHEHVIAMSRHQGAARQLTFVRMHNLQRHFPAAFQVGPVAKSEADHVAIGEAIIAGDAPAAERAMRAHLDRVVQFLVDHRTLRNTLTQRDQNVDNPVDKVGSAP